MRSLPFVVAVVCLLAGPGSALGEEPTPSPVREGLLLESGTLELGGAMTFRSSVALITGQTGFEFSLSPRVGYFVVDRLELELALGLSVGFGDGYTSPLVWFTPSLGARYHFELGSRLSLYVGLEVGLSSSEWAGSFSVHGVLFSVPVGLLVALNHRVALDLGVQPTLEVDPDTGYLVFTASVGYLGVRAFF